MPIVNTTKGNLLKLFEEGEFNVIAHGCNCQGVMGAGIAKQIADRYPVVAVEDRRTCDFWNNYDNGSLKMQQLGHVGGWCRIMDNTKMILNMYTQLYPGAPVKGEDRLKAIRECFATLDYEYCGWITEEFGNLPVGIPMIGAGLAGGDWNEIKKVIDEVTPDTPIVVVEWDGTML